MLAGSTLPRVLVVEDDPVILTMVCAALQREPLHLDTAGDGIEGLAKLREFRYAVVLVDLMMPRMNGFDLLEAMMSELPQPRPVVFVMTAYDDAVLRNLDAAIVQGIIRKPFDLERLVQVVRDCAFLFHELTGHGHVFPPPLSASGPERVC